MARASSTMEIMRKMRQPRRYSGLNRGGSPATGKGYIQRLAERYMRSGKPATTGEFARFVYARKILLKGRKLRSVDYERARKALARVADVIGRVSPRRSLVWQRRPVTLSRYPED